MKALAIFCKNYDERERAIELDLKVIPEYEAYYEDFYFSIAFVAAAYKNDEGNINLVINDGTWSIKWDQKVWDELIKHLDNG